MTLEKHVGHAIGKVMAQVVRGCYAICVGVCHMCKATKNGLTQVTNERKRRLGKPSKLARYAALFCLMILLTGLISTSTVIKAQSTVEEITSLEWNSQQTILAVGGILNGDNGVHLFDTSGQIIDQLLLDDFVHSVSWGPDDSRIAAFTGAFTTERRIVVWDVVTNTITNDFPEEFAAKDDLKIHWNPQPSSQTIATILSGAVLIYDLQTEQIVNFLLQDSTTGGIFALAWSNKGSIIFTLSGDDFVRAWNVDTETVVDEVEIDGAESLRLNPDGDKLAVGVAFDSITILDADTLDTVQVLQNTTSRAMAIRWNSDGSQLAGSDAQRIITWDVSTGNIVNTISLPEPITSVNPQAMDFGPNDALTYVGDNNKIIITPTASAGPDQTTTTDSNESDAG